MADDPTIRWTLASGNGILVSESADAWHSGHVTDLLPLQTGGVILSTETAGVWILSAVNDALPLSDTWADPDVNCLCQGPDGPRHFFAGCKGGALMETDAGAVAPVLDWRATTSLPSDAGAISSIVLIPHLRRIVVACLANDLGGAGGIFWSVIPGTSFGPVFPARPPYQWRRAVVDMPSTEGYFSLAVASTGGTTVVEQLENIREISIVCGAQSRGVYVGGWDPHSGDLYLRPARQIDDNATEVTLFEIASSCSVASCAGQANVCYAACASADGRLMEIVRSEDGGNIWKMCGTALENQPPGALLSSAGEQGARWNNCIAVASYDANLVAVGWQKGIFFSIDGGRHWKHPDEETHLHADLHAVRFDPLPEPGMRTILIGSDGGVARLDIDAFMSGTGQAYRSDYNRNLPTLQCYSNLVRVSDQSRQFYGSITASARDPGLIAIGVQDNGNLFCRSSATVGPRPWVHLDGGDGGWNAFMNDATVAHNAMGFAVQVASFDNPPGSVGNVDVPIAIPQMPGGLIAPVADAVARATFSNAAGRQLLAVAALNNRVWGLYSAAPNPIAPYQWESVVTLPADVTVSAVGSSTGATIYAGSLGSGRMFAIDTVTGAAAEQKVVLPKPSPGTRMQGGTFTRIFGFAEDDLFAILNGASETPIAQSGVPVAITPATLIVTSYVMRLEGKEWRPTQGIGLPGSYMWGADAVAAPRSRAARALVVSTDDKVYISRNDGANWQQASMGLPRRPHCGDLRFVRDEEGGANIYLGTYGRSVWVAELLPPNP